jgi:hypothetical protein
MSRRDLAEHILQERRNATYLFDQPVMPCDDEVSCDSIEKHRFPNELAALYSFVNAYVALPSPRGAMTSVIRQCASHSGASFGNRSSKQTVRPRTRHARQTRDPSFVRSLDDYTELKSRIMHLSDDDLFLLVSYYVLKKDAKSLSRELDIDV